MIETFEQALNFIQTESVLFWQKVGEHLSLSFAALSIAIIVCVPLGIFTSRFGRAARIIINLSGVGRVIPSIAILLALYPFFGLGSPGIGSIPSLIALTLLAIPPVLINTDAGLRAVSPATIEVAKGMGMTAVARLWRVEIPLALPLIIGGIRTASVETIASATLATFIGGGGLGDFILQGLAGNDNKRLLVGALPVAFLALTAEISLASLQRYFSPKYNI